MTSTEEEIDTCQNNDVHLGFQNPGALLHWGLSVCSKKNSGVLVHYFSAQVGKCFD